MSSGLDRLFDGHDPIVFNRLTQAFNAMFTSRQDLMSRSMDPRRDVYDECGFLRTEQLTPDIYWNYGDRDPIAARVNECLVKESWQLLPTIYESEDAEEVTPFEVAWDALGSTIQPGRSWFKQEAGSAILERLKRVDALSGIGHYGALYFGFADGGRTDAPVKPRKGLGLRYLFAYPEYLAQITQVEGDRNNPRFGQPNQYLITTQDTREMRTGVGTASVSIPAHWSRVLHVADTHHTASTSDVWAVPRMRPILNNLYNLEKIYASDGEAYWRQAILKLFFETHPELGGDVETSIEELKDAFESMMNGLQHWMFLRGMSAKSVSPQAVDPTSHVNVQLEAICIKLGVPMRVFKGSERGELASSQDDAAWNDRLKERQSSYITPCIIVPFVDRLIQLGVLPEPKEYFVHWPSLTSKNDLEKADVLSRRVSAHATYISGGVEALLPPMDYLTREAGFTEEEAKSILTAAAEAEELPVENVFCPTGEGGGVDPTCSPGASSIPVVTPFKVVRTQVESYVIRSGERTLDKLDSAELNAVSNYAGNGYVKLNRSMRSCPPEFECLDDKQKFTLSAIESAIAKAGAFEAPVDVYRGIGFNDAEGAEKFLEQVYKAKVQDAEYQMPSLTSTSADARVTKSFSGPKQVLLRIRAKTGLYVEPISGLSEDEVLLSSRTKYRVVAVGRYKDGGGEVLLDEV